MAAHSQARIADGSHSLSDLATDVTVQVDPEDNEQSALCEELPSRQDALSQLYSRWRGLLDAENNTDITRHYLGGKVHVNVVLSPDIAAGDC